MWKSLEVAALVAILVVGSCLGTFGLLHDRASRAHAAATVRPFVKIIVDDGTGSGVYIGGGNFLTAGHVVTDYPSVEVKSEDGKVREADVLWRSKTRDVALIHSASDTDDLEPATLDCSAPRDGEAVIGYGNPVDAEFFSAAGRLIGRAMPIGDPSLPWTAAVYADLGIVPGMSGGAVVDDAGLVRGIMVGSMLAPTEYGVSLVGIGVVVPAAAICGLLARA